MKFHAPNSIQDALAKEGSYLAGGTDIMNRHALGMVQGDLIDLQGIEALKQITWEGEQLRIGAMVSPQQLLEIVEIEMYYQALYQALQSFATPQIKNSSTIGGALLQHNRCWYYRNPAFKCYKDGGDSCPARNGNHKFGVCFDMGPCISPHPSSLGLLMMIYDAHVNTTKDDIIPIESLYGDGSNPGKDHLLEAGHLLTHITLPKPEKEDKGVYLRSIGNTDADWPLVEVAVRLAMDGDKISFARVGAGGIAPIPIRFQELENKLIGQKPGSSLFQKVAYMAISEATPLPQTQFKVQLLYGTLQDALQKTHEIISAIQQTKNP